MGTSSACAPTTDREAKPWQDCARNHPSPLVTSAAAWVMPPGSLSDARRLTATTSWLAATALSMTARPRVPVRPERRYAWPFDVPGAVGVSLRSGSLPSNYPRREGIGFELRLAKPRS